MTYPFKDEVLLRHNSLPPDLKKLSIPVNNVTEANGSSLLAENMEADSNLFTEMLGFMAMLIAVIIMVLILAVLGEKHAPVHDAPKGGGMNVSTYVDPPRR